MAHELVRYMGLHHVAFYRASFESDLSLEDIAKSYLETGADIPAAKRTLKFIQNAFCQTAMRHGKHGAAALLRVPRKRFREQALPDPFANAPSLDDYRDEVDPAGFYGEAELLDMYRAEYGQGHALIREETPAETRRLERNARLLAKKIQLINDLAPEIAKPPVLEDTLEGWFDQRVSKRFEATPIRTLGDLILFMNHRGYRWYRAIPKLGEVTAKRILSFLNDSELSGSLSPFALMPIDDFKAKRELTTVGRTIQTRPGIAPLEQIAKPASDLDGSTGLNRADPHRNRLSASNDLAAINAWLKLYTDSTERAYRKEAERLLLWTIYTKRKPFSSLTTEDIGDYVVFLEDPQPAEMWVADKKYARFHPAWRPFVQGGLQQRSIAYAAGVLSTLSAWLVGQRYLDSNPFDGLPRTRDRSWRPLARSLSQKQWQMVRDYLDGLLDDLAGIRLRFLVDFLYTTGLRIHEISKAQIGDLTTYDFEDQAIYYLKVKGKGGKEREVPLASRIIAMLTDYLRSRGEAFQTLADLPPETPIISTLDDRTKGLSMRSIDHLMRDMFTAVANETGADDRLASLKLRKASTHWLRHTYATHALQKNMSLKSVRENLGHSSLATTSIYTHTELTERHKEIESFVDSL